MKTFFFVAFLLLSGCAFMQEQVDYAALCSSDPVCLANAKEKATLVSSIASAAYPAAGPVAGAAALAVILWFKGKRKKESAK